MLYGVRIFTVGDVLKATENKKMGPMITMFDRYCNAGLFKARIVCSP